MSPNVPFSIYLRRLDIAQKISGKKRVRYKWLAAEYSVSERTIKRDVFWIRKQTDLPSIQKIVGDKVVKALESCDEAMFDDKELILKYGLPFLGRGIPQTIQSSSQHIEEVRKEFVVNLSELSDNAKRKILAAEEALADAEENICQV